MRVLVTGAGGFVGSKLIPRLLRDGHEVRAFVRDRARLESLRRSRAVVPEAGMAPAVVVGDAGSGKGLADALEEVDVAYYLIHSMERPRAGEPRSPFPERERRAAENFASAAAAAGVGRIVYLGGPTAAWSLRRRPAATDAEGARGTGDSGLAGGARGTGDTGLAGGARGVDDAGGELDAEGTNPLSPHLRSRERVAQILREAVPDTVVLRASIVIGAGSRSFRFLVRLVERLPVLALPAWHTHRTRPIDARNVIEMLAAAASSQRVAGRSLDLGGPDVLSYGEMLVHIADLMLVSRPAFGLRVNATPLTARVAAAIVEEDPELVVALMESLQGNLLPDGGDGRAHLRAAELLGVDLHSFDSAVERALREWESVERLAAR